MAKKSEPSKPKFHPYEVSKVWSGPGAIFLQSDAATELPLKLDFEIAELEKLIECAEDLLEELKGIEDDDDDEEEDVEDREYEDDDE